MNKPSTDTVGDASIVNGASMFISKFIFWHSIGWQTDPEYGLFTGQITSLGSGRAGLGRVGPGRISVT